VGACLIDSCHDPLVACTPALMRILIVEDEQRLADFLVKGLHELGHIIDVARDGIEGRRLALGGEYDLLILDVMLPGVDGFSILESLRKASGNCAQVPVLMLTARDGIDDRMHEAPHELARILSGHVDACGHFPHERHEALFDERVDELLAIAVVVVHERRRHVGMPRHARQRRCRDPVPPEQRNRRIEDARAAVVGGALRGAAGAAGQGRFSCHGVY
jgi:CheY-like chemotaxis protein